MWSFEPYLNKRPMDLQSILLYICGNINVLNYQEPVTYDIIAYAKSMVRQDWPYDTLVPKRQRNSDSENQDFRPSKSASSTEAMAQPESFSIADSQDGPSGVLPVLVSDEVAEREEGEIESRNSRT